MQTIIFKFNGHKDILYFEIGEFMHNQVGLNEALRCNSIILSGWEFKYLLDNLKSILIGKCFTSDSRQSDKSLIDVNKIEKSLTRETFIAISVLSFGIQRRLTIASEYIFKLLSCEEEINEVITDKHRISTFEQKERMDYKTLEIYMHWINNKNNILQI